MTIFRKTFSGVYADIAQTPEAQLPGNSGEADSEATAV